MKLMIIFFFITITVFSDIVKIDEIVSINFPAKEKVTKEKTDGRPIEIYEADFDNQFFQVIKAEIFPENFKIDKLAINEKNLDIFFTSYIDGFTSEMESINCKLKESVKIKYKTLTGYKLTYVNKENNKTVSESKVFIVNNHIYSSTYLSHENFNEEKKDFFFNSLSIDDSKQIKFNPGTNGKSRAYVLGQGIGRLVAISVLVFIFVRILRKKKKVNSEKQ